MSGLLSILLRSTLVVAVAVASLATGTPQAAAHHLLATSCGQTAFVETSQTQPVAPGNQLLVRDGTGFFAHGISSIAIGSASVEHRSMNDVSTSVTQTLSDHYADTSVDVLTDLASPATRAVVIDGDIAVPGYPSVFLVGGTETLYLHWTTAEADIGRLLVAPSFRTLAATEPTCIDSQPSIVSQNPEDMLAYVDSPVDETSEPQAPIANSPRDMYWLLPLIAGVLFAGGVAVYRRDKIWPDRFATAVDAPIVTTRTVGTAQPIYPIADRVPTRYPVADLPPATAVTG